MLKTFLLNAERLLLPLPFPVVIIWWVIIGGILGSFFFGATYASSWGILPVAIIGMWRVITKVQKFKKKGKRIDYLIKKGKHRSNNSRFTVSFANIIEGEAFFEQSCFYLEDGDDKYDISKLIGLSAYYFHHIESVRIGFRTNIIDTNLIDLFVYAYDDKVRVKEVYICSVAPLERFSFKIEILPDQFVVRVNNTVKTVIRSRNYSSRFKYVLYPYYGGNQKAKRDMHISLTIK
jgi:hypothetical protein